MIEVLYVLAIVCVILMLTQPSFYISGGTFMSKKSNNAMPTTESGIRTALSELLGIEENDITLSSKIQEDLGADSLDVIEFVMLIEEQFNIQITDDQGEKIVTVADAVRLVNRLVVSQVDEVASPVLQ